MTGPESTTARAATWYAARGWPVLPLYGITGGRCTCGAAGCVSPGKHPRLPNGVHGASAVVNVVNAWWRRWPDSNVGIAAGAASGIVALDIDPRHGGDESLAELEREHGPLPPTVEACTGGGGRHLLFRHPGGDIRNRSNVRPGIDVRADGGYIVVAPSVHASGRVYEWRDGHWPHQRPPVEMPAWLLDLVRHNDATGSAATASAAPGPRVSVDVPLDDRIRLARAALRGLAVDDRSDGSRRVYAAAAAVVRHDLPDDDAIDLIMEYLAEHPGPRDYSCDDVLRRLRDAERNTIRGGALIKFVRTAGTMPHEDDAESLIEQRASKPSEFAPFPLDALPDGLCEIVEAVSDTTGADPAFAAIGALPIAAAAVGTTVALRLKSGYVELPILWSVLVGRSGAAKSPTIRLLTGALHGLLADERRRYADALKAYRVELLKHQKALARWKRSKADGDPPPAPEPPRERRVIVRDATTEKLIELLENNPRGLLLVADELAHWHGSLDAYKSGSGGDLSIWLQCYDGGALSVDRKVSTSHSVRRAAVSIVSGVQPGILAALAGPRERAAGLLPRCLMAWPPHRVPRWTDQGLPPDVEARWAELLRDLLAVELGHDGEPVHVGFDRAAAARWAEWHDDVAARVEQADDDEIAAGLSKSRAIAARLALVFAAVRSRGIPACVTLEDLGRAVRVVAWASAEWRRVTAALATTGLEDSDASLIRLISGLGGAVTPRELARCLPRYRGQTHLAELDLEAIVASGRGRWEYPPPGPRGGRPTKVFRLVERASGAVGDAATQPPALPGGAA